MNGQKNIKLIYPTFASAGKQVTAMATT